jgi:ABC-type glycerol-3-phosphate transport system substrate-binding protein
MLDLVSDRNALRFAKEEGRLPARTRTYRDPFFQDPDIQVFVEQLKSARILQGASPDLRTYGPAIKKILVDKQDAAATLREAQTALEATK